MARTLRYHPLFDCDVREAAGWYDRRSPGLGDAFVEVVRQGVADVTEDPQRFALSRQEINTCVCRDFRTLCSLKPLTMSC